MKGGSDDTAPVRTKAEETLWSRELQNVQLSLLLGWRKADLGTTVGFKATHHPCARHGIHGDRGQPRQSPSQLTAAGVA